MSDIISVLVYTHSVHTVTHAGRPLTLLHTPDVHSHCYTRWASTHSPIVCCVSMEKRKADVKFEKPMKQLSFALQPRQTPGRLDGGGGEGAPTTTTTTLSSSDLMWGPLVWALPPWCGPYPLCHRIAVVVGIHILFCAYPPIQEYTHVVHMYVNSRMY